MAIERIGGLDVVRHETDPLISVYRGDTYLGAINPPMRGYSETGFEVVPVSGGRSIFRTEAEALASFA